MLRRSIIVGAWLLAAGGCTQPATEVVVDLGSDIPANDGLYMVVSVGRGTSTPSSEAHVFQRMAGSDAGLAFPSSFAVIPAPGESHNDSITMLIDLNTTPGTAGEPPLAIRRTARFAFTAGRTTHLPIFLSRSCGQPATGCDLVPATACTVSEFCDEHGQTCGDYGACVSTSTCTSAGFDGAFGLSCDGGTTMDAHGTDAAEIATGIDSCTPMCSGRMCGSDGCGSSCGSCATGQNCNTSGQCVCTPNCSGRACGSDGCGGSCGSCGSGQRCNSSGQCVCAPNCSGRSCGSNGCGGSCGSCASGTTCSSGQCVCAPNCSGRSCGSNGCGGSCGTCASGLTCSSGQCVCPTLQCGSTCCGSGVLYCGHVNPGTCCYTCGGTNCPIC